jgi:hypothetical protein
MRIGDWCEAQNMKATALAKQLEEEGIHITRQALSKVMSGEKEAPLGVALRINELSGNLVTLNEMVLRDDEPEEMEEEKTEEAEDLDDLLAGL